MPLPAQRIALASLLALALTGCSTAEVAPAPAKAPPAAPVAKVEKPRPPIPAGHLYVQGTSIDSFDSRYSLSGLVRVQDVKAKVIPIL